MGAGVEYSSQNDGDTKHRVLIVEDELFIALDLEAMVKTMGFDVAGLATGKDQALQLASVADIAFVDVNLSDGPTGPEIGRRLAEEYGVTVVFMTGNPEAVAGRLQGALGVVTKPAMPAIVGRSNNVASSRLRSNVSRSRATNPTAVIDCPPKSKKSSSIPMPSTFKISAQIAATDFSVSVRGGPPAPVIAFSGAGSALRFTFPFGVSGNRSSVCQTFGTM